MEAEEEVWEEVEGEDVEKKELQRSSGSSVITERRLSFSPSFSLII